MYEKCILLVSFCLVLATVVSADIRNGYTPDLASARECLRELSRRLTESNNIPASEHRRINAAIRRHLQVIAHYELTEALLRQMRIISPDMYDQMDQLTDKRGRVTDIYVRFIPEEKSSVMLSGASFFQASARDEDANRSRFGEFTVSIDIWICETALNLLAHEFGHTKYIVPNIAAYRKYYRHTYARSTTYNRMGHSATDVSGRMAYAFGRQFLRDRRTFRQTSGEPPRRVVAIIRDVRRSVLEATGGRFDEPIASSDSFE